jgi:hypothetical protein
MTRSGLLLAAALALTVTAGSAEEDFDSANHQLRNCKDFATLNNLRGAPAFERGFCAGMVYAFASIGTMLKDMPKTDEFRQLACMDFPQGVTVGQKVKVVVAYIEAHPALMHEDFRYLALIALQAAWPCR